MAAGAAFPGLFFSFVAMLLLIFASVSSPVWERTSFLNAGSGGAVTRFGVFGYTGSRSTVGYIFPTSLPNPPFGDNGEHVFHALTTILILIPVAAGLAALAVLFGLCGIGYHRMGTALMMFTTALASFVTLLAFIIELVIFVSTRQILHHDNIPASLGNANWLVLGAFAALLFASIFSCCGMFGRYGRRNNTSRY